MTKRSVLLLVLMTALILTASPLLNVAWAQPMGEHGEAAMGKPALVTFGTAVALGFAAALCGLGQGWSISAACQGIARNPGAGGAIRLAMLLGLAFIESLVIYALLIALVLWIKI